MFSTSLFSHLRLLYLPPPLPSSLFFLLVLSSSSLHLLAERPSLLLLLSQLDVVATGYHPMNATASRFGSWVYAVVVAGILGGWLSSSHVLTSTTDRPHSDGWCPWVALLRSPEEPCC